MLDRPSAALRPRRLLAVLSLVVPLVVPLAAGAQTSPPYGILINGVDHTTPRAEIAARMENARQANASWVRADFYWYSNEWTPGAIDWRYFDALVQEADARGLRIIATLLGTPSWAASDGIAYVGVPDMAAWERFVARTAARYRGVVDIWEIWNEPDKFEYWRGTPAQYAELLARASQQIRANDPAALVALGGLAQGGGWLVVDFLAQVLGDAAYPAGQSIDLHNIHTNFRTASMIASQVADNRHVLAQYGVQKPIIATEASYTSDPAYQTLTGYEGGGEDTQARYVMDAYGAMIANGITVGVWATEQDYSGASGPYAATGLSHADRTPKAAYDAFRTMAAGTTSQPPPPSPPPPAPAPITISDLTVEMVRRRAVVVRWTTSVPGTSVADYGTTPTGLTSEKSDATLTTSHSLRIGGLTFGLTYYLDVTSVAADGSSATSSVVTFTLR